MKSIPIDQCPAGPWLDAAAAEAMGLLKSTDGYWIYQDGKKTGYRHRKVFMDDSPYYRPSAKIEIAWGLDGAGWLWHFQEYQDGLFASVERDDTTSFHCFICWDGAKTDAQIIQQAYALARTRLFLKVHGITEVKIPDD